MFLNGYSLTTFEPFALRRASASRSNAEVPGLSDQKSRKEKEEQESASQGSNSFPQYLEFARPWYTRGLQSGTLYAGLFKRSYQVYTAVLPYAVVAVSNIDSGFRQRMRPILSSG